MSELANKHYQGGGEVNIQAFKDVRPAVRVKWNEQILPRLGCCKYHCTVPQSQGDPKMVKRGPNFGQKGDPKGTLFDVKGDLNLDFFRIVHKERIC